MKKNLQEYFDSANRFLDSQDLLSQQQYQNLIESKPINPAGKIIKMSNKFIQRGVIMSIVGVVVLIGLYFGSGLFNANEPSQKVTNKTQLIVQSQSKSSEKNLSLNKSEEKILRDDSQLNPPESFKNIVPIIRLSLDELKNLGFFKIDSGYALITETTIKEEIDPQKIKSLSYYGYKVADSTSTFKEKFTIDTFKSKMDIIPYRESKTYKKVLLNPITFNRHYKRKNGGYGFMGQGLSDANNIEMQAIRKVFVEIDRFKNTYIFQGKLDNLKSDFVDISDSDYTYITKLIPIYFTIGNPKENGSENIIWYVASKMLINSLPERYKNILLGKINLSDRIYASKKDKEQKAGSAVKDESFDIKKGFIVALIAGVMSACFAFGEKAGADMVEIAKQFNPGSIWVYNPVYAIILIGGFVANMVYCITMSVKNKSFGDYSKSNTSIYYVFAAVAGLLWFSQFVFKGMGTNKMSADMSYITWCLLFSLVIVFSNIIGIITGEWKGVSKKSIATLITGLLVLIGSVLIIGFAPIL